jgi:hypothetical protein
MEWLIILILAVLALAVWSLLDPDERRARQFRDELANRQPIDDTDLCRLYFSADMALEIPGYVRQSLATEMGYSAAKILPDDDLMFFWRDVDLVDVVRDWEGKFGIRITQEDASSAAKCTVRSFAELINRLWQNHFPLPNRPMQP